MNEESTTALDKDLVYVTYCDGVGCNASTKAALKLAGLGFRVKELMGGLDWWKRDGHPVEKGEGKRVEEGREKTPAINGTPPSQLSNSTSC